jgi:hypothetical protein
VIKYFFEDLLEEDHENHLLERSWANLVLGLMYINPSETYSPQSSFRVNVFVNPSEMYSGQSSFRVNIL